MKKKLNLTLGVIYLLANFILCAETQKNLFPEGDFDQGSLNKILDHYQKDIVIRKGGVDESGNCLYMPGGKSYNCTTLQIKVEPFKKYRLSFFAKIDEKDFELSSIAFNYIAWTKTKSLPIWGIKFYSKSDKKKTLNRQHRTFYQKIISNKWQKYIEIFYPPKGADTMTVTFGNGRDNFPTLIDNIYIEELNNGYVNINPDFSLGPYNYSGYGFSRNAWIKEKEGVSGKFELDATEGFVIGDAIPVSPGKYNLEIVGRKGNNKKMITTFFIDYHSYDKKKEKFDKKKPSFFRFDKKKMQIQTYDFIIPPGIDFICLRFAYGIFGSVKIKKMQK